MPIWTPHHIFLSLVFTDSSLSCRTVSSRFTLFLILSSYPLDNDFTYFDIFLCRVNVSPFHISKCCTLYYPLPGTPIPFYMDTVSQQVLLFFFPMVLWHTHRDLLSIMGPHFHNVTKYRLFEPNWLLG